jgi:hypothetical protein
MVKSILSRSFILLFRFMHWLLDQGRKSDIRLISSLSLEQVMARLTGESDWKTIFSFDAIGHRNGIAVERFFEIPLTRKGYTSILPIPLTHDYPSNYALVGSLQLLPDGKTLIKGRFRLSNLRTIFFALVILVPVIFLFIAFAYSNFFENVQPVIIFGFGFLIFLVLLPSTLLLVSIAAKVFEPISEKRKVVEYVRNLLESKSFPGSPTRRAHGRLDSHR